MTRAARLLSGWASTCSAPQATLSFYTRTRTHAHMHAHTHIHTCLHVPMPPALDKALQSQCAMSSLCQHILYPNVNVTEYNQSPEQPGSAEQ